MTQDLLTVLVVDDELPLRQELRLFPWVEHGCELVGEAENGEEALQFCRTFCPDIVLTDVTMPIMDGIEFLRAIREENPLIQVVLLTCHSDFSYAREALKLGAVDYIVKVSMEERDLQVALTKAKDALHREVSLRRSEVDERRWSLSKELVKLTGAGAATLESENLTASLKHLFGLHLPLILAALHLGVKKENRLLVKREIEQTLTSLERPGLPYVWIRVEEAKYLLFFEQPSQSGLLRSQLETLTNQLVDAIDKQLPFLSDAVRIYAVVGEPVRQTNELGYVYDSVTGDHPQPFYDAAGHVFFSGSGKALQALQPPDVNGIKEKLNRVKDSRDRLKGFLREEFLHWCAKHRIQPDLLKGLVLGWRQEWLEESAAHKGAGEMTRRITEAQTAADLVAALIHEIDVSEGNRRRMRKEVVDAKAFIDRQLEQSITLNVVARHVGLSPQYLSKLFREEVGCSFHDYLTRKRMEQAVHLLQTTALRVYEVAQAVGIPSYRYFTSMFREYTGASPTDYKKG